MSQDFDSSPPPWRSYDRTARASRAGGVGWVLLVAALLVAAAAGMLYVHPFYVDTYVTILLAGLGTLGVFCAFALAAGILRFGGRETGHALLKSAVDAATDATAITDQKGRVVYANAAYLDLTAARDDSEVRPVERVFIGDPDVSEAIYRLMKAAREGRRLQEEVRIVQEEGRPARWLQLQVRPLGAAGKEQRFTVWAVADITRERDRHENVFQELQHAIDYLDHAPAGFFSVDRKGAVGYLNATLANWLDHDLARVGSGGLTLNDVVAGEGAALLTAINGAPGEVKTEVLDLDMKTRGGRPVPVRLYHKVAFGADGAPGASRTLVLNRARDEVADPQRAAEVQFMRFFHNTPMAIATVDKTGRIIRQNARFASTFEGALKADERSILSVVTERDRRALEGAIRKAAEGHGEMNSVEAALAGQGERWANFFVLAVGDDSSEAAIVYALETTAQRTLENRINQQQKMESVGQLAGGIAHDFNNVLSAIMMATDFLLNAHKPTDPSFQDIMQIKQNANRAAALVRQLLAFSRKQTLRPQVLDLNETLNDLTMLLRRLIGEKVTLNVVPSRELWPVRADLSQFEQVIVNLAVNARDAMPEGGALTMRTSNVAAADSAKYDYKGMPYADYVLIEVIDTGTGIPANIIDKIFEPFFSTKEVGKGTGLGLSTVYGIVKQTGGYIYAESKPGLTTFRIFLPRHLAGAEELVPLAPVAEPQAVTATMAAAENLRSADLTGQGTILLVEDEDGLRALNARGLASRGYTVLEAANGLEAIEVLEKQGEVDLVVSDVVMPEMDGPALLKELRRRDPNIKFIFVSGYAEDAFAKSLPEGEMPAFLAKPFTLKQLVQQVKESLSS
ncbi:MAG: response regulator [Pseudolabrys sp.]|nr:response regulator [Pseudolabrys sp.]MBV9955882.1 response regulator [Pseudolabrys sp.]